MYSLCMFAIMTVGTTTGVRSQLARAAPHQLCEREAAASLQPVHLQVRDMPEIYARDMPEIRQ